MHPPDALRGGAHDALHQLRHVEVGTAGVAAPGADADARHVLVHLGADHLLHRGGELRGERVLCRRGGGGGGRWWWRRGGGPEFLEVAVGAVVVEPLIRPREREGERGEGILLLPPADGAVDGLERAGPRHRPENLPEPAAVAEVAAVRPGTRPRRAVRRGAEPLARPLDELGGIGDHSRRGGGAGGGGGGGGSDGELALEGAVPVVLHGVVGAALEEARDGGPPVPEPRVCAEDGGVLLGGERPPLHLRRELVAPPQPARLPRPPGDLPPDRRPVPRAVPLHQPPQRLVLLGAPRPPDPVAIRLNSSSSSHGVTRRRLLLPRRVDDDDDDE